ncbi:hypothetical protein CVD28_02730 [Bacillus sp. M6-12]|uniref:hypothetical protein n=1 Tax=Bacillus sp. M6-12 TaxID=2054166 RepID=UPI000C794D33|nr:hypothetical protein [Bacillus sp. M6-12]PLS19347.1 hypothetical protein CVD28_02730 [Bacillus sp. M6-12]
MLEIIEDKNLLKQISVMTLTQLRGGLTVKYDKQKCPQCEKDVVTLYKKKREDIALCYWCDKRREKALKKS